MAAKPFHLRIYHKMLNMPLKSIPPVIPSLVSISDPLPPTVHHILTWTWAPSALSLSTTMAGVECGVNTVQPIWSRPAAYAAARPALPPEDETTSVQPAARACRVSGDGQTGLLVERQHRNTPGHLSSPEVTNLSKRYMPY